MLCSAAAGAPPPSWARSGSAAREAGCTGKILIRFDSAFYNSAVIRTAVRHGAHFSVTVPKNSSVRAAIARIPEKAWTPVKYPQAAGRRRRPRRQSLRQGPHRDGPPRPDCNARPDRPPGPQRPDQPRPGPHHRAARQTAPNAPDPGPRTSRTKGERTNAHAPNHLLNQSWR
jgi:hypothetical protein